MERVGNLISKEKEKECIHKIKCIESYLEKFSGTMASWGHSFLAINPGIAALTPNLRAS